MTKANGSGKISIAHLSKLGVKLIHGITQVEVKVTWQDIHDAVCKDHTNCVGAVALKREGGGDLTRIDFEANEVRFSYCGYRWVFHPEKDALNMLRAFDELGEEYGQDGARERMPQCTFTLTFLNFKKLRTKTAALRERDKIRDKARNLKRKELGLPPRKTTSRIVGTVAKGRNKLTQEVEDRKQNNPYILNPTLPLI